MKPNEFDVIMGLLQAINNKIDNLQFSLARVYQAYKIKEPPPPGFTPEQWDVVEKYIQSESTDNDDDDG